MISLKSKRELEYMQEAGAILRQVFRNVEPAVKIGVTTAELDIIAEETILKAGGTPAFKGYRGFPKTACISVNDEVVHGIPSDRKLKDGDIISFDVGAKIHGFYSDAARSWPVGEASEVVKNLIRVAKGSFEAGLAGYKPGCRIGDLSNKIQEFIESNNFEVVRDYVGHGIGRAIHEEPQVPNYGSAGRGPKMEPGLVLAIEPMVTEGSCVVSVLEDGWTVSTKDGKLASHYEDSVAFTEEGFINLTGS